MKPLALHSRGGQLLTAPVARRRALAADQQIADGAGRDILSGVVDDAELITRNWLAGAAWFDFARAGGEIDVQHFGGADSIQDLAAESVTPFSKDLGG